MTCVCSSRGCETTLWLHTTYMWGEETGSRLGVVGMGVHVNTEEELAVNGSGLGVSHGRRDVLLRVEERGTGVCVWQVGVQVVDVCLWYLACSRVKPLAPQG